MSFLALVPLLPLLTAGIVMTGDRADQEQKARSGLFPIAASFLGSLIILIVVISDGPIMFQLYDPAAIANLAFPIGVYIDRLSAVMMVLITGVTTLIYRYSMGYMYQDRGYRRYLGMLAITTSVLLCMVSSGNLVMLFIFWQILSWLLFLLAHNHGHAATLSGASNTFTTLRLSDAAFLAGIVLAYSLYGTFEFHTLFTRAAETPATLSIWPELGWNMDGVTAVTLLIFGGAMGKSAQFPIHTWLPRSLYAPTPIHALLHAGIINAGGFLLNRLAPLYGLSPTTLHVVFVIGMLTAILGATMMLTQNDIKKTLGFSTIGQMGYMIMECGLGAFSLAVFHLIAHGLFKGTVFLNCGNVIHKARQEPSFPPIDRETEESEFSNLTWFNGIFHDPLAAPGHSVGHSRRVENSAARITRDRDLPVLHLGHLFAGDPLVDAHSRRGLLEGVCRHAGDSDHRRLHLSVCGRELYSFSVPEPRRGGLLFQGRRAARTALRQPGHGHDVIDDSELGLSVCPCPRTHDNHPRMDRSVPRAPVCPVHEPAVSGSAVSQHRPLRHADRASPGETAIVTALKLRMSRGVPALVIGVRP
ncbi:MAG: NADH-quinone oxidoreductase subunit L [Nitrospira sp.]